MEFVQTEIEIEPEQLMEEGTSNLLHTVRDKLQVASIGSEEYEFMLLETEQLMEEGSEEQINAESGKLSNTKKKMYLKNKQTGQLMKNLLHTVRDKLKVVSIASEESTFKRKFYNSIARVPKHLRDVNEKSYEPQIIAIGPYHRVPHVQPHLEMMQEYKTLYLKKLLERTGEEKLKRYLWTMAELEGKARACYDGLVKLSKIDFVEMMLLDACFIVELFRKKHPTATKTNGWHNKPALDLNWINEKLIRDLLLVENQLPFFVLQKFFEMTQKNDETNSLFEIILFFFGYRLRLHCELRHRPPEDENFHHLLNLVHDHLVYEKIKSPIRATYVTESKDREVIRCATELKEAGIKFMMVKEPTVFHIQFQNGTMRLPTLTIDEDTESFFRNLIVYEQYYPSETDLIIDYIKFMDCLINSAKDVELLCQRKIIHNCLGDDEVVANMFNRLCDSVTMSSPNYYRKIYSAVNKHCSRRQNRWMASLRHNYFNTPWAHISFTAATLLLSFTLIQTVFSVKAYFK